MRTIFIVAIVAAISAGGAVLAVESTRKPSNEAPPQTPGAQYLESLDRVAALEKRYDDLNDKCRGGPGDDPETVKSCDEREHVAALLKNDGYCWRDTPADAAPGAPPSGWIHCD